MDLDTICQWKRVLRHIPNMAGVSIGEPPNLKGFPEELIRDAWWLATTLAFFLSAISY